MQGRFFDLIGFDADDTLWHNERSYQDVRARFRRLLSAAGLELPEDELEARIARIELANLEYFGYGVTSFALSLIETAIDLTGGRVAAGELRPVIEMARQMITERIELFAGARDTLAALSPHYSLVVITKGDLLHQTSKLERSGLKEFFRAIEVVSHKTPGAYAGILGRHGVDPRRFLMVGNSLRSDVLPVIEAGGWAVHVPAPLSWAHEHADLPEGARARCFEVASLADLLPLLEELRAPAAAGQPPAREPLRG